MHDFVLDRMVLPFLSSISQISLSLRDGRAQGAEDSGDTTQLRDLVRAAYLLYGICNFLFSIRRSPSPLSSTALL